MNLQELKAAAEAQLLNERATSMGHISSKTVAAIYQDKANPTTIFKLIAVAEAAQWQVNSATFFSDAALAEAVEELEK